MANVNDVPTGTPVITGTAQEDQTLTADTSGIGDADVLREAISLAKRQFSQNKTTSEKDAR